MFTKAWKLQNGPKTQKSNICLKHLILINAFKKVFIDISTLIILCNWQYSNLKFFIGNLYKILKLVGIAKHIKKVFETIFLYLFYCYNKLETNIKHSFQCNKTSLPVVVHAVRQWYFIDNWPLYGLKIYESYTLSIKRITRGWYCNEKSRKYFSHKPSLLHGRLLFYYLMVTLVIRLSFFCVRSAFAPLTCWYRRISRQPVGLTTVATARKGPASFRKPFNRFYRPVGSHHVWYSRLRSLFRENRNPNRVDVYDANGVREERVCALKQSLFVS